MEMQRQLLLASLRAENEVPHRGLTILGTNEERLDNLCQATKVEQVKSNYGASPETCIEIMSALQTSNNPEFRNEILSIDCFFLTMNWLKGYKKESELAVTFNRNEKVVRQIIRCHLVRCLQKLLW